MSIEEAMATIEDRNGIPLEDDWDLAVAADTIRCEYLRIAERASVLRNQILLTWDPPLDQEDSALATDLQTAAMQTIAFILGKEFVLSLLSGNQIAAIETGLPVLESLLMGKPSGQKSDENNR